MLNEKGKVVNCLPLFQNRPLDGAGGVAPFKNERAHGRKQTALLLVKEESPFLCCKGNEIRKGKST